MNKKKISIVLYLLPAFLIYTIFMAYPLFSSLKISFYSWSGYGDMTFVGLQNYIKLFTVEPYATRFINALSNNVLFFIITMILQNGIAFFIAYLLSKQLKGSTLYRTIIFIPTTLSILIIGFMWTLIFNPNYGVLNSFLMNIGLESMAKSWLGDPQTAIYCIIFVNAWQYMGLAVMLFLAGIQGIPDSIIEASKIDGCNGFRTIWHIVLPTLKPVIWMITILTVVGDFSSFELIYAMEGTLAGPAYSTDVLGTLFYRTAFGTVGGAVPEMGLGAAIATCTGGIIMIFVVFWLMNEIKRDRENA